MTRPEDARARLLRAAVGFALVPPTEPELRVLHQWLDCWRGVSDVVTGMNRHGYFLHLSDIEAGTWRASSHATRYLGGTGSAPARRPWRAVQRAAWEALANRNDQQR